MAAPNLTILEQGIQRKEKALSESKAQCVDTQQALDIEKKLLEFYRYDQHRRDVLPTDLIPDDDRKAVIPPKDFAINVDGYVGMQDMMSNLYDYILHLSLQKRLIPTMKKSKSPNSKSSTSSKEDNTTNPSDPLRLTCLDAGCSVGGLTFRISQHSEVIKVFGVDLSPSFIDYAKEKQSKMQKEEEQSNSKKITFLNQDASVLPQFKRNEIDVGFCSLVLHEMPRRVPMNILCELARVCKYLVLVDWVGPDYPWNAAGINNRSVEYKAGPEHFNGFLHFVRLGGIQAHVESLQKHRKGIKVMFETKMDQGTSAMYILDTIEATKVSPIL